MGKSSSSLTTGRMRIFEILPFLIAFILEKSASIIAMSKFDRHVWLLRKARILVHDAILKAAGCLIYDERVHRLPLLFVASQQRWISFAMDDIGQLPGKIMRVLLLESDCIYTNIFLEFTYIAPSVTSESTRGRHDVRSIASK